jgi:hypothetical protein
VVGYPVPGRRLRRVGQRNERRRTAEPEVLLRADEDGAESCTVSSCVRTMRGVSSITMSVCCSSLSFEASSLFSTGRRRRPGMPLSVFRSVLTQESRQGDLIHRPSAQSRVDTPRAKGRRFWPATLTS